MSDQKLIKILQNNGALKYSFKLYVNKKGNKLEAFNLVEIYVMSFMCRITCTLRFSMILGDQEINCLQIMNQRVIIKAYHVMKTITIVITILILSGGAT